MKKTILLTMIAFLGLSTANAQVGIGTTTPDASSILDVTATDKGFLPPRMTTAQRDAIASPAEGLTIFNTTVGCVEFYNSTSWINICDGTIASGPCAGSEIEILFNGLTYRPIGGVEDNSGVEQCWLNRNLGATVFVDSNSGGDAAQTGYLYQWGRSSDGHQIDDSSTSSIKETNAFSTSANFITTSTVNENWLTSNPSDLWANESSTNNPCPPDFRVPTPTEFITMINGIYDGLFGIDYFEVPTANLERYHYDGGGATADLSAGDIDNIFNLYWTSTAQTGVTATAVQVFTPVGSQNVARAYGLPVRCIKD